MDKLKLAHDYAKKFAEKVNDPHKVKAKESMRIIAENAWNLADAMQAEWGSRVNKDRPDVLQEWQPDWSQAPDNAHYWQMSFKDSEKAYWTCKKAGINIDTYYVDAPTFGYIGKWQDSLRKRP